MGVWTADELRLFKTLSSPEKIQAYLDSIKYNTDSITRSPRAVIKTRRAHCFDGALFAAAALELIGAKPLVMYLESSPDDDDHVLALFRHGHGWGAIAKSNYTTCRYRDPIYRSLRELAMSYFDGYFNLSGKKTLRAYYQPFNLQRIKDIDWHTSSEDLDFLDKRLKATRKNVLINKRQEKLLTKADDRLFRGATIGLDPKGAFKVRGSRL